MGGLKRRHSLARLLQRRERSGTCEEIFAEFRHFSAQGVAGRGGRAAAESTSHPAPPEPGEIKPGADVSCFKRGSAPAAPSQQAAKGCDQSGQSGARDGAGQPVEMLPPYPEVPPPMPVNSA